MRRIGGEEEAAPAPRWNLSHERWALQNIYELATARLRNPPLDPMVEHDLGQIVKQCHAVLSEPDQTAILTRERDAMRAVVEAAQTGDAVALNAALDAYEVGR